MFAFSSMVLGVLAKKKKRIANDKKKGKESKIKTKEQKSENVKKRNCLPSLQPNKTKLP